jgi:hypothetical protein
MGVGVQSVGGRCPVHRQRWAEGVWSRNLYRLHTDGSAYLAGWVFGHSRLELGKSI